MHLPSTLTQEKAVAILSKAETKAECAFVAIWKTCSCATFEEVREFYEVERHEINTILDRHWVEFEGELDGDDGWTPRATLRLGMLLSCLVGEKVRTLALDVIEALTNEQKRTKVVTLLKNSQFVGWSDREISKVLDCDHKTVGKVRQELELGGEIPHLEERTCRDKRGRTYKQPAAKAPKPENTDPEFEHPPSSEKIWITISDNHPHHGGKQAWIKHAPNKDSKLVELEDGTTEYIQNQYLDSVPVIEPPQAPRNRLYTQEEVDDIREQHKREIERLEADIRIGVRTEEKENATLQVIEELTAARNATENYRNQAITLQQEVDKLQALKALEQKNEELVLEIKHLRKLVEEQPGLQWQNTFSNQASQNLNKNLKSALESMEPHLHLTVLAKQPPLDEDVDEIADYLGKAIANIQPIAVEQFRAKLKAASSWQEFEPTVQQWRFMKKEIWKQLDESDRKKITFWKESGFAVGSHVTHIDPFYEQSKYHGTVVAIYPESGEVDVRWEELSGELKDTYRYKFKDLRILKSELVEVA